MPNPVRLARPEDEAALFRLLMALKDDNNRGLDFRIDDDRVMEHIVMGTRMKCGMHGVIDAPDDLGELAGSIGVIWDRLWFSSDWGLAQLWLFVRPKYRNGNHYAENLVDWAKSIRDDLEKRAGQRVLMANSVISTERLDAKLKFWQRHSGHLVGGVFMIR
jgi:hypothetical protein